MSIDFNMSSPTQNLPSLRKRLKLARSGISYLFPGIVRIVYDPGAGTLKTSFAETKLSSVIKYRQLYAKTLAKHGFNIDSDTLDYSVGTWRVGKGATKKLYHVLTFVLPVAEGRRILCSFVPLWKRVIRQKTDEEIDRELNAILTNRNSLIKKLGISTHIHL
jgi:hypothetical protein